MNLVMNEAGEFIEVQGTGEGRAFSRDELDQLLSLGQVGIRELMNKQQETEKTRA
jgi:ribonuclease PH